MPSNTLAQRLQDLGLGLGFSQIAEMLDPAARVARSFQPQDLSSLHLDVIVQIPASSKWQDMNSHGHSTNFVPVPQDGSPFKRQRLADDPGSSFKGPEDDELEIMKRLWQDGQDPSAKVTVHRGSDPIDSVDVLATMNVLCLPPTLSRLGSVMIRSEYEEAMNDFDNKGYIQNKSVIIVGHPGIGRTMGSVGQAGYSYMRPLI
jgi:hypothetical protein